MQKTEVDMKTTKFFSMLALAIAGAACDEYVNEMPEPVAPRQEIILTDSTGTVLPAPTLRDIAKAISELPMRQEQLNEVYEAVSASSGNGYDEEYMMSDLFLAPGSGVGSDPAGRATKAVEYRTPLRDMLRDYFTAKFATKAGAADIEAYINSLIESDAQIYWPYSEDRDGRTYPIVTFDPGYGAESNYGYEIRFDASGARVVDSVFFIKCGSASGFKAETDDELRLYNPEVTDFMIVVKRKQVMEQVAVDAVLVTDFTPQIEKIAFMIIEMTVVRPPAGNVRPPPNTSQRPMASTWTCPTRTRMTSPGEASWRRNISRKGRRPASSGTCGSRSGLSDTHFTPGAVEVQGEPAAIVDNEKSAYIRSTLAAGAQAEFVTDAVSGPQQVANLTLDIINLYIICTSGSRRETMSPAQLAIHCIRYEPAHSVDRRGAEQGQTAVRTGDFE